MKLKSYAGYNSHTVWDNLIIFDRDIINAGQVGMLHARRTTLAVFFFLVISPKRISKPNSYALHIFLMVWNILIRFGTGIDKD